jgi:hypothetical protein
MIRYRSLEHRFVEHIPDDLQPGLLYISLEYGSVAHSCCCGCGEEIVTPLTPTDWKIVFDGETISLTPSVGNWNLPCRSHYVIRQGRAIEAGPWTEEQISAELRRNRIAKSRQYARESDNAVTGESRVGSGQADQISRWKRTLRWVRSLFSG